jgi:hypothetical protein
MDSYEQIQIKTEESDSSDSLTDELRAEPQPKHVVETWSLFEDEQNEQKNVGPEVRVTLAPPVSQESEVTVMLSDNHYNFRVHGTLPDPAATDTVTSPTPHHELTKSENIISTIKDGPKKAPRRVSFHGLKKLEAEHDKTVSQYAKAKAYFADVISAYNVEARTGSQQKGASLQVHAGGGGSIAGGSQGDVINAKLQMLREQKRKLMRLQSRSKHLLDEIDSKYLWAMHNTIRKLRRDAGSISRDLDNEDDMWQNYVQATPNGSLHARDAWPKASDVVALELSQSPADASLTAAGTNISHCIPSFLRSTRDLNKCPDGSAPSIKSASSSMSGNMSGALLSLPSVAKRPFFRPSAFRFSAPISTTDISSSSAEDATRRQKFAGGSEVFEVTQIPSSMSLEERNKMFAAQVREAKRYIQVYEDEMLLIELGYSEEDRLGVPYPMQADSLRDQVAFIKHKLRHWTWRKIEAEEQVERTRRALRREQSTKVLTKREPLDEARDRERTITKKYNKATADLKIYDEELRRLMLGFQDKQRMGVTYPRGVVTISEKAKFLKKRSRALHKQMTEMKAEKLAAEQTIIHLELEREKKKIRHVIDIEAIKEKATVWNASILAISRGQSEHSNSVLHDVLDKEIHSSRKLIT